MRTLKKKNDLEKYMLYKKAAEKTRKELHQYSESNCPDEKIFSCIYKLIKEAIYCPRVTNLDKELATSVFQKMRSIIDVIGMVTPSQLEYIFPIQKIFDGEKYGVKDYFYTKNLLNQLPQDRVIGETTEVYELLWDYVNKDLRLFIVRYINAMDDLRACDDEKSILQEFCENNDIPTYRMFQRVHEKKPSHLRIVK